jgi:hypothetical protein
LIVCARDDAADDRCGRPRRCVIVLAIYDRLLLCVAVLSPVWLQEHAVDLLEVDGFDAVSDSF